MAMHADVDQPARLAGVQVVEHVLVDVEIDARAGAERPVVDELAPRDHHDLAALGLLLVGHARVERVRAPGELRLGEIVDGVFRPAVDRRHPAGRPLARGLLQDVERLLDGLAFAVGAQREQRLVLQPAVAGDVLARLGEGRDRLRPDLGAAPVAEQRRGHVEVFEIAGQPPDALVAAEARPVDPGDILGAGRQRRGARKIARRLAFAPGLEQHAARPRPPDARGATRMAACS